MASRSSAYNNRTGKPFPSTHFDDNSFPAETLPSALDSGDIVLFNRRCVSMPIAGAALCFIAKIFSNSQWDHVGIVIRHPATGELLFLEADFGGVKLRSLQERVRRSKSNEIAVRRLSLVRTSSMREKFYAFAQEMIGRPYEIGTGSVLARVSDPLGKQERERLSALLLDKRAQVEEISRELERDSQSSLTKRLLQTEQTRIMESCERVQKHLLKELDASDPFRKQMLVPSDTEKPATMHDPDLSRVFCSELAAAAFQRVGLIGSYPPAFYYNPKDFSSDQTHPPGLHLLKNARLSPEIFLRQSSRRGREKSSADHSARPSFHGIEDGSTPSRPSRDFIHEALKRTPLYNSVFDKDKRDHLVKLFRARIVEAGDIVFEQGQYGNKCYIVAEGQVERFIQKGAEDTILVSTMGTRATFGMTAFMFNTPRVSTVRAKERTLIWELDRPTFELFRDAGSDAKSIIFATDNRRLRRLLKEHFLFRRFEKIGANEVDAFFLVNFQAGEEVFQQGDTGDNFYIIKSGELEREIRRPVSQVGSNESSIDAEGMDNSTTNILRPNESFGELSIMFNAPRGATVRARTDAVCWAISAESFHRLNLTGGTQHLRAVFNKNTSVFRDGEAYMTRSDFLNFVNINAIPENDRERLSALLISLVTSNRLRDPIQSGASFSSQTEGQEGSRFLQNEDFLMDFWEFVRFDNILNQPSAESSFAFLLADQDNAGRVSNLEALDICRAYDGLSQDTDTLCRDLIIQQEQVFGKDRSKTLTFREFTNLSHKILPSMFLGDVASLTKHLLDIDIVGLVEAQPRPLDRDERDMFPVDEDVHSSVLPSSIYSSGRPVPSGIQDRTAEDSKTGWSQWTSSFDWAHLFTVGLSGVISRTTVAPLERLKVLMQVSGKGDFSKGWMHGLKEMVRRDGSMIRACFRGNGTNLLRIVPSAAIQLVAVDQLRRNGFPRDFLSDPLSPGEDTRVVSKGARSRMFEAIAIGGLSGMLAAAAVYPIDFVRARLTVQRPDFQPYRGFFHAIQKISATEGPRTLYRGLAPSLAGVFPCVGLSFALYEVVRPVLPKKNDQTGVPTTPSTVLSGIAASAVGQVAAYPLDTCRRRMQVVNFMSTIHGSSTSFLGTWRDIRTRLGWRGFFRGVTPCLLKITPASLVSFIAYEHLRAHVTPIVFEDIGHRK